MKIRVDSKSTAAPGETLVRFYTKGERSTIPVRVPDEEWAAEANATLLLHDPALLCVGLGKEVTAQSLRTAAGTAIRTLQKAGRTAIALDLRKHAALAGAVTEGTILASYNFQTFKTKKSAELKSLRLIANTADLPRVKKSVSAAEKSSTATNLCRSVGNLPGNLLYPETLATQCRKVAKDEGLKITILDEKALEKGGFGGLMAVGKGSERPPRLIILRHQGGPASQAPIALVGKAITFDTGGISIKPADRMEEMVFDKCGGMAVLGAMAGIARLGLKRNVVGIIASAENMPSSNAYRPGDIVKTYDGTFIEVVNTDAEGRMVLADAIAYARKDCKAAAIVDLATLTGACVVALGEYAAGLWSTDDKLRNALTAASEASGERIWPMPLYEDYTEQIRSQVAAFKNSGGRYGGACTAAAFLRAFAGDTPWAHLDIAGVSHTTKSLPHLARGATGFGARTLIQLVENWR